MPRTHRADRSPVPWRQQRRCEHPTGAGCESKLSEDGNSAVDLAPALYLVATPIGNSRDITLRALDVLSSVAVIACEDTRVTAKLLAIHGIRRPLARYDEHSAERAGPWLIERIRGGEAVALTSDAGTPLISDPGSRLVSECIAMGIQVIAIPGPSAVLTAVAVAGLPTGRFLFGGYLPPRTAARRRELADLAAVPATLVLLEAPHRLAEALADAASMLGTRPAVVARELTKHFEEVVRGSLPELAARYAAANAPRGEITLVIGPPPPDTVIASDADVDSRLREALTNLAPGEAASQVAAVTGRSRRAVYARALALRKASRGE